MASLTPPCWIAVRFSQPGVPSIRLPVKALIKAESVNYQLWESKLSSLAYQQWQRGFQGVPINPKELNQRIVTISYLRDKLLAKLPDLTVNKKSTSQAKGWNSPKLVDSWLRSAFSVEVLKNLDVNEKSQFYSFDSEARDLLIYLVPDNKLLPIVRDFKKKDQLWGELKNTRKMQTNGILRYGYQMAGTATGRFTSSKPAIHNFSAKSLDPAIFTLTEEQSLTKEEIEQRYDIRTLLLKGEGVYRLDFATQENRMVAYLTENSKVASIFIQDKDFHSLTASELGIDRKIAKVINLAPIYGMGTLALATKLKVSEEQAANWMATFWDNNPELKHFKKELMTCEAFTTPLYGRKMYLRGHMRVNWVIQGSCAELLWEALKYLESQFNKVQVLPHFHDELVLKCKVCKLHDNQLCQPIKDLKEELEALYPFVWPGTNNKVFKLEVK